ncbi:MAG: hypothetical protein ACE5FS_05375 [Paracoccaceae bacterium]
MFRMMFALSLGIGGMIWLAHAAQAQTPKCAERARIVAQLQSRFGEKQVGMGMQDTRAVVEIFVSPESGSWTILVTRANGVSCMAAAGRAWTEAAPASPDDPGA